MGELVEFNELVGFVSLFDAAGAADDGGDVAHCREYTGFGAKTDLAGGVGTCQFHDQSGDFLVIAGGEAGHIGHDFDFDPDIVIGFAHLRDQGIVEIIENQAFKLVTVMIGQIAEFEIDIAILRDDVELCAAMDHAAMEGCVVGNELVIMRAFIAEFLAKAAQEDDKFRCKFNCVDPFARKG